MLEALTQLQYTSGNSSICMHMLFNNLHAERLHAVVIQRARVLSLIYTHEPEVPVV